MVQRNSVLTTVGRNKEAAKTAENLPLIFTEIALGDGTRFPAGGETALENEVHRGAITDSGVESAQPNVAWFDLYVPAEAETFHAQEIGLFDEDGDLYALARYEQPVPKFGPSSSSTSDNTFRILVVFADTENIVVHTSPISGVSGTRLISTEDGLSGGGSLAANRTLVTNWSNLSPITTLLGSALLNVRHGTKQFSTTVDQLKNLILTGVHKTLTTTKGLKGGGALSSDRTIETDWSTLEEIGSLTHTATVNIRQSNGQYFTRVSALKDLILNGVHKTLTTTKGLKGGGVLSSDRTIETDWSNLTPISSPTEAAILNALQGGVQGQISVAQIKAIVLAGVQDTVLSAEQVQDIIGNFINSTGASVIYDDAGNALSINVANASAAVRGIIQIATDVEAAAGVNTTKAINAKQLKSGLDQKAPVNHTHAISQVTALQDALDGKAPINHTHPVEGLTDLRSYVFAGLPANAGPPPAHINPGDTLQGSGLLYANGGNTLGNPIGVGSWWAQGYAHDSLAGAKTTVFRRVL